VGKYLVLISDPNRVTSSYYSDIGDTAINTRDYAEVLVESSVFENGPKKGIFTDDNTAAGYAVVNDVDFGGSQNLAPLGNLTSVPYAYTKLGSANVKAYVTANAGQKLSF
jgi:pectate lyase